MADKNLELMKKIIEEKNRKSAEQGNNKKAEKNMGKSSKSKQKHNGGGLFRG